VTPIRSILIENPAFIGVGQGVEDRVQGYLGKELVEIDMMK